MYYPTLRDLEIILQRMNKRYGMSEIIINKGQLDFALDKPKTHLMGGNEQYPELYQKAAVLMEAITKLHTFSDGNKRCGMMAAEFMVKVNGGEVLLPLKAIRFSVDIAMDENDLMREEIMKWFKVHIANNRNQLSVILQEQLEEETILKTLLEKGKYEEAEKLISSWLAFDTYPEHKKKWEELVTIWKESDKQIQNKKIVESEFTITAPSDRWKSVVRLAKYDLVSEKYELVMEVDDVSKLIYKGHSLEELCNYEKIIENYESYMKQNPKDEKELHQQGLILVKYGKYDEAVSCFNELLSIKANDIHYLDHKATILHYDIRDYEGALKCYEEILKLEPDDKRTIKNLGIVFHNLDRYAEAISYLDIALKNNPNDQFLLNVMGQTLSKLGKQEEAIPYFDKVLNISKSDAVVLINKAVALARMKRHTEALEILDKVLEIDKNNIFGLYNKALALTKLDKEVEAIPYYNKILELNPDYLETIINLGSALSNAGKRTEAIPYFKRALEIDPNHDVALVSMGITLHYLNKYDEALSYFDRELKNNSKDAHAHYCKACTLSIQGKILDALDALEKAIKIDSSYKEQAKSDIDLDNLREAAKFKKLVG